MYWFSSEGHTYGKNAIIKAPMYGEDEYSILRRLPAHTHFAIDYYDRKMCWTGTSDENEQYGSEYASEIKCYKLDTDEIQDSKVVGFQLKFFVLFIMWLP